MEQHVINQQRCEEANRAHAEEIYLYPVKEKPITHNTNSLPSMVVSHDEFCDDDPPARPTSESGEDGGPWEDHHCNFLPPNRAPDNDVPAALNKKTAGASDINH